MGQGDKDCLVLSAKRTPFGAFGGALRDLKGTDLGVHAAKAALAAAGVDPTLVDESIFGNVVQTTPEDVYCARHIALRAGVPVEVPALTVNRLCGSGFQAAITAAQAIALGEAELCLVGGTESMSLAPHVVRGARWGLAFGKAPPLEDSLWAALTDTYAGCAMGVTAENVAALHNIGRQACDEFALQSQQRWTAAQAAGRFAAEIVPVEVGQGKKATVVTQDEHPRPNTQIAALEALRPVFKADGVVTAGNASGIADGAAALVLASRGKCESLGVQPLAKIHAWASVGVEPKLMGLGPVPAMMKALSRAGMTFDQMDLIEVNEAFAAQFLAVEKLLDLPREKTNVDGGAIALGHPLGASGARILAHLVHELRRRQGRFGIGAACIGGGQGIAVLVETLL
ncbi:MAG: acetyl-CoA C-acyltransferase [Deltaproteobacteria bacterium]|nr:acetyl-CoA C-acyltransferase [Deltaproteobacteria bacterium]